jgi:hypothetical protein
MLSHGRRARQLSNATTSGARRAAPQEHGSRAGSSSRFCPGRAEEPRTRGAVRGSDQRLTSRSASAHRLYGDLVDLRPGARFGDAGSVGIDGEVASGGLAAELPRRAGSCMEGPADEQSSIAGRELHRRISQAAQRVRFRPRRGSAHAAVRTGFSSTLTSHKPYWRLIRRVTTEHTIP